MTIKYNNVFIEDAYTICGNYENDGPLSKYFDKKYEKDLYFGEKSWEQAEVHLLKEANTNILKINKLKEETNNSSYIVYREKYINNIKIDIIYNEVLTDQDKMSNFIYRSLDHIEKIYQEKELLYDVIKNNISNIKIKEINNYQDICKYLNNGFVILLIEDDYSLALEVKKNLTRSIEKPMTETTIRAV